MASNSTTTTKPKPKNSRVKQRVTLFLKSSILKHAKAEAIVEEMTLTNLVEKALISYLPVETVIRKPKL